MNFSSKCLNAFKNSLQDCYEHCSQYRDDQNKRDIYFNTTIEQMQIRFSLYEVGEVLSIIQEAAMEDVKIFGT